MRGLGPIWAVETYDDDDEVAVRKFKSLKTYLVEAPGVTNVAVYMSIKHTRLSLLEISKHSYCRNTRYSTPIQLQFLSL
jgi:hypothetical protein